MEGRAPRVMVIAAIVIVLFVDAAYVSLIVSQSSDRSSLVAVIFVAFYLLLMAAMLGTSLSPRPRAVALRTPLRAGAAGGLVVLGVLAVFSIGVPVIVAGALATGAAVRTLKPPHWTPSAISGVAAAVVAVAVLVAGFEISGRLIICPATGISSATGYLLVSGGYHWTCVDGKLDFRAGYCTSGGGGIDANGHAFTTSNCG